MKLTEDGTGMVTEVEVVQGLRLLGRTWTLVLAVEPSEVWPDIRTWYRAELVGDILVAASQFAVGHKEAEEPVFRRLVWDRIMQGLLKEVYG